MKRLLLLLVLMTHCAGSLLAADYYILDFGAVPGKRSTVTIQKAVDQCHAAGGGRVIVPPGTFITGCVVLKSNVTLHLEPGAELLGSENMEDYRVQNVRRGMIFCEDAINVSISGSGT